MLTVKLDIEGTEALREEFKRLPAAAQADLVSRLDKLGKSMSKDLRAELAVKAAKGEASAPGEPPLSQSGGLYKSIGTRIILRYGEPIRLVIGSVRRIGGKKNWAFYGQILEAGAKKYEKGFKRSKKSTAWLTRVAEGKSTGIASSWFKKRQATAAASAKAQLAARANAASRMEPRPWMKRVLDVYEPKFNEMFQNFMKQWFPGR